MPAPVPVVESTSPVTNVQLVAAGIGWSVVPEQTAKPTVSAGRIRVVPIRPAIAGSPVTLIFREHEDNPRVALLRDALHQSL